MRARWQAGEGGTRAWRRAGPIAGWEGTREPVAGRSDINYLIFAKMRRNACQKAKVCTMRLIYGDMFS